MKNDVDDLAQKIRSIANWPSLGAGRLAEELAPLLINKGKATHEELVNMNPYLPKSPGIAAIWEHGFSCAEVYHGIKKNHL